MTFKLQHPQDLISRLFMLEYMRELGAKLLYSKADKHQKSSLFYKFTSADATVEEVDVNWEACLFEATVPQIDFFLQSFIVEIEEIDKRKQMEFSKQAEEIQEAQMRAPVDVNVMDLAATAIKGNKNGKLKGIDGLNQL